MRTRQVTGIEDGMKGLGVASRDTDETLKSFDRALKAFGLEVVALEYSSDRWFVIEPRETE